MKFEVQCWDYTGSFECDCDPDSDEFINDMGPFISKMEETYGTLDWGGQCTPEGVPTVVDWNAAELDMICEEEDCSLIIKIAELTQLIYEHLGERYNVSNLQVIRDA